MATGADLDVLGGPCRRAGGETDVDFRGRIKARRAEAVAAGFAVMWREMGVTQADCMSRSGTWTRITMELRELLTEAVGGKGKR